MLRNLGFWILSALIAGAAAGVGVAGAGESALAEGFRAAAATLGGLWLDALRVTVVPLLFALVVYGIASAADAATTGRLAGSAVALFVGLMFVSGLIGLFGTPALLALWPVDPGAAAALVQGLAPDAAAIEAPTLAQTVRSFVPSNIIQAAAQNAVLPLVTFAVAFGFAATRTAPDHRASLIGFFRATAETMTVIVRWVLLAAPLGVFGLAVGLGAEAGLSAAPLLLQYVAVVIAVILAATALMYLLPLVGRVPLSRFVAAVAPVQALAASTQSSLACLPANVERARGVLKLPERVIDVALPMGVALFRVTGPAANVAVVWFVLTVHGIEPTPAQLAAGALIAPLMSLAAVGLPGQVSFFSSIAPIALVMGAPLELLAVLVAVEVIPDVFRTIGNVTGHLGAAAALSRGVTPEEG